MPRARQRRKHRPHVEQRLILNLGNRAGLAAEDEISDRNAPRIEPHDDRWHGAGRHHRSRAVHVIDRLGHRLSHVRAGMKDELHQRRPLHELLSKVVDALS